MFEEEANLHASIMAWDEDTDTWEDIAERSFKDGAEFGYNKANEWHYVKDGDLHFPFEEEKDRVVIWKVQVITEQRIMLPACYHCGSYDDLWYEIKAYHVIAWKEITLPEEE